MKAKFFPLGLLAILATSSIATYKALAWTHGDPHATGCDNPSTLLDRNDRDGGTFGGGIFGIGAKTAWVDLKYSSKCGTNWVTAQVPTGSRLYLEDLSGKRYVVYTTGSESIQPWWTDMADASIEYRACVERGDNGHKFCTKYVP